MLGVSTRFPHNEPKTRKNTTKQKDGSSIRPSNHPEFADKLCSQANTIVFVWTFLGLLVGGAVGYQPGGFSDHTTYAIAGAGTLGIPGFAIGISRAFLLRLQAQVALCQKKIEENTRH